MQDLGSAWECGDVLHWKRLDLWYAICNELLVGEVWYLANNLMSVRGLRLRWSDNAAGYPCLALRQVFEHASNDAFAYCLCAL